MTLKIPQARFNVFASLLDLTKRTDSEMDVSFSSRAVFGRGRNGDFLGEKISPLWDKKDEPRSPDQVEAELQWIHRTGYANSNILYDGQSFWGRTYIIGYRIKPEKISEVEEILRVK